MQINLDTFEARLQVAGDEIDPAQMVLISSERYQKLLNALSRMSVALETLNPELSNELSDLVRATWKAKQ